MKIAIPVDKTSPETPVSVSFGRAPFFIIHDTVTEIFTSVPNPGADASGGAGVKAAQAVVDSGADTVITFRCGENAAEVLAAAGVTLYTAGAGSVFSNVEQCIAGKLSVLHDIHSGFHHNGENL